jgi:Tfp pilus assembly protein FimV
MAPIAHPPRRHVQGRAIGIGLAACSLLAVFLLHIRPVVAAEAAPAPVTAKPAASYTPRAGETLDHVIQVTMPDSPLKMDLLRRAFISQNPQAFVTPVTTPPRMKKGAVLTVPDHQKLLLSVAAPQTAEVDGDAAGTQRSPAAASSAEERKRWVRYP